MERTSESEDLVEQNVIEMKDYCKDYVVDLLVFLLEFCMTEAASSVKYDDAQPLIAWMRVIPNRPNGRVELLNWILSAVGITSVLEKKATHQMDDYNHHWCKIQQSMNSSDMSANSLMKFVLMGC